MKKVTMFDVAKLANVSKSTVSQYINHRFDYMGEETKQRIEAAIKQLGYQPNHLARSLKQKKTSVIGVIVANILHSFTTQMLRAIEDYCQENDFHVIVCNADDEPEKEKKYIEMLRAKQVDGLIVFPTGANVSLYERMIEEKYPLIFIDRTITELNVRSIMLDNMMASKLAVTHFLEKGYKEIGIITPSIHREISSRVERRQGFRKALLENEIEINEEFIKSVEIEHIKACLQEMLSAEKPIKAIVAGNDLVLMEILSLMKEERLSIPEDLAVICIDDVSFASLYTPALTTIKQPAFQMGMDAAKDLLRLINEPDHIFSELISRYEPHLVKRESC